MGRITARDLARTGRGLVQVVVADRERMAERIPGVESARVDVTDRASLARSLAGAWATIASLPYRFNLAAMEGALEAGAHSCLVLPIDAREVASMVVHARAGNQPGRHTLHLEGAQSEDRWRDDGGQG